MKRVICLLLTLCLLAACGLAGAEGHTPEGKPWLNSNLLYNLTAERPAPENGFDMYANYDAYREALDNGSNFTPSTLTDAYVVARKQVIDLCTKETAEYAEDEILRILYGMITDTEKRNADGFAPLTAIVDRVKAAKTTDDLLALVQEEGFLPCDTFFNIDVQQRSDDRNQVALSVHRIILLQLKTDDRELAENESYTPERDTDTPKTMLTRLGYSEEEATALVKRMEEYDDHTPEHITEWPDGSTKLTIEVLKEKCPLLYAQAAGMGMIREGPVYEIGPEEIDIVNECFTEENLDLLKVVILQAVYKFAVNYLDEETWKAEGKWSENDVPDENVYDLILNTAGIAVDQAYLKHYCPEENREKVVALYHEYKDAMRNRITQNSWMDEETKRKSLEKLELIEVAPFEAPGGMFDLEPLKTALQSCTTLLEAAGACKRFLRQCSLRYAGEPVTRGNRYVSLAGNNVPLMLTNGQYNPEQNMIFIGAPALNMPMFDTTSRATMLGTIGHHIAHELSHAFDSYGSMVDAARQGPLFTEEAGKYFADKVNALIERMNRIELLDGVMLNGQRKNAELIADLTGVSLSLDLAKKTEDFDYARFFLTYASFFRTASMRRDAAEANYKSMDLHPAPYVRVNFVVAQFEEFYKAFPSVTEGTLMYVAPEDRFLIW